LARELHQSGHKVQFVFAGALSAQSEYAAKFRLSAREAEQAGYGSYAGTKSTEELIELFDKSDAMLHFPTEEAFGLVVAESLARNLKFFGTAIGGVAEICSAVELTELYPPNDWQSLKSGIIRWLEQGCPKPTGAADLMAARYHPDIIARRHVEIYREVLGRSLQSEA
jgi:glycosyltransferase involved in cell wall biosynthesis